MSIYTFAPTAPQVCENHDFVLWHEAFTDEELDRIEALCDALEVTKATIAGREADENFDEIRKNAVAWLELNAETGWLYDRLAFIARSLNGQFYRYDLTGFVEHLQFSLYEGDGGHYDWHIDAGSNSDVPRKLSLVLQLSDPDTYEGGELQVQASSQPTSIERQRGLIAAFPAFRLHRVTPVTKGQRKSLVVWVAGPQFR